MFLCLLSVTTYSQNIDSLSTVLRTTDDVEVKTNTYKSLAGYYRTIDSSDYYTYYYDGIAHARAHDDQLLEFELTYFLCRRLYANRQYEDLVQIADRGGRDFGWKLGVIEKVLSRNKDDSHTVRLWVSDAKGGRKLETHSTRRLKLLEAHTD